MISNLIHILIPLAHAAEETSSAAASPVALFGLNIKLFIAQLFNFAIVVFVLWRWVFTPLSKKLAERSEKIQKSLENAGAIEERLQAVKKEAAHELHQARVQAAEIIAKSASQAEKIKEDIIKNAQAGADKALKDARAEMEREKKQLIAEVREDAANLIVAATEKIIRQKLNPEKDKALISDSLKDL